ncbi:MAG: hypothetical protein HAW66_06890 [Shewanella sp.]|nr:hypothetical protein [Shewanella sp.]
MANCIIHQCEFMPSESCQIEGFQPQTDSEIDWKLVIYREATEEDLEESNYLEEEGDLLWQATLKLTFCPYCGKQLANMLQSTKYPEFSYEDFRSW